MKVDGVKRLGKISSGVKGVMYTTGFFAILKPVLVVKKSNVEFYQTREYCHLLRFSEIVMTARS